VDDEIDRKIDVKVIQFLLVQNRQQTHDWTLIGSGANGIAYNFDASTYEKSKLNGEISERGVIIET